MKFRSSLFLFALGACFAGGFAAEIVQAPAQAPCPEEMLLAYALLEAAGTPDTMEQTLQHSLNAQLQSAPELLPFRSAFESYLRRTISYEAQKEELARAYLSFYTPDEMRELIRFYQPPIGRKKAAADAKIAVALAEVTRRKMAEELPRFQQELQKLQQLQQPAQTPVGPRLPSPEQP